MRSYLTILCWISKEAFVFSNTQSDHSLKYNTSQPASYHQGCLLSMAMNQNRNTSKCDSHGSVERRLQDLRDYFSRVLALNRENGLWRNIWQLGHTAAHEFLPPGSKIHLQSEKTNHSVVVEVNDWNDTLLVSYSAGTKLGVIDKGVAPVVVERVEVSIVDVEDYLNNTQLDQLANFQQSCGFLLTSNYQP